MDLQYSSFSDFKKWSSLWLVTCKTDRNQPEFNTVASIQRKSTNEGNQYAKSEKRKAKCTWDLARKLVTSRTYTAAQKLWNSIS